MPDIFDMVGDATTTDKGTIYDYNASAGEAFGAGLERSIDTNPFALGVRAARTFSEDMGSLAGAVDRIDQKTAEAEVKSRGLDLKIPVGGITRYELDTLQYLKQREIRQNTVSARTHGVVGTAAGFAGGLVGSLTDPINVASNFIPFVSEARYARWLAQAGESTLARAAVRVGAGAIEGAAGAAVVEPLVYAGATSEQLDYTSSDSFLNVAFGGIMGGGLHAIGGAVYDARVSRALRSLDPGLHTLAARDAAASAPEHVQREALQVATRALEADERVDVAPVFTAYHGSPYVFDRFSVRYINRGEGAQSYGHGLYFAENIQVAESYKSNLGSMTDAGGQLYQVEVKADREQFLDFDKRLDEQSDAIQQAVKKIAPDTDMSQTGNDFFDTLYEARMQEFGHGPNNPSVSVDVSKKLKDAGVRGIRYLDQLSRKGEASKKTHNLVVFDDADVEIVSRNGQPTGERAPQPTPRDLAGLIEQSKADRTQAAFDRQFVDPEDAATSKAADDAVAAQDFSPEDIAAETAQFTRHLESMRERGLVTESMEAEIKAADAEAEQLHAEADAYEAAAICAVEAE